MSTLLLFRSLKELLICLTTVTLCKCSHFFAAIAVSFSGRKLDVQQLGQSSTGPQPHSHAFEPWPLKRRVARAHDELHSCSPLRRCEMPRRGWSHFETPSGGYTVVRGWHPPSEIWPKQQWSWWRQRSQWPSVAAARHQTTKPKIPRRWDRGGTQSVHQPRQKFTQPQSTVCVVSRQPSKLLGLVPKRRTDWKKHLSWPNEGRSSWGAFGFHGTVRGTLPETTPECRGRCEGGHRLPRQGSGRDGGRATESGDSQSGGCSTGAGTPNSANCRQR